MGDVTYINGRLVNSDEAVVSAMDAGFLYGDGLFETMRSYGGRVFALDAHLKRLAAGAKVIGIANFPGSAKIATAIEATIWANFDKDTVVRVTVTRGNPNAPEPTIVIQTRDIAYTAEQYQKGVSCVTIPEHRGFLSRYKTLNYLPNMMAKREANKSGFFEALFVGDNGITEGAFSSLFAVKNGILRTPGLEAGILDGVTRSVVLGIARKAGLETIETALTPEELYKSEEVFITNSVMEIMPVSYIDKKPIGTAYPGVTTARLMEAYKALTLPQAEL